MRVLVTGASGYVGSYVCPRLLAHGWQVVGLTRSATTELPPGVERALGDVVTGEGLSAATQGATAVVHLVGIIAEKRGVTFEGVHVDGTRNVLKAAETAGARKYVHMSANGASKDAASRYQSTKAEAEELVRASNLEWIIMRPSLIFGEGDEFFGGTLKQLVTAAPVVPVVGSGEFPFRPVWAEDVATAFARALAADRTGSTFELAGPTEYTLREMLGLIRDLLRPGKPLVSVPLPLMRVGVQLFKLLPNPPITHDQFLMLLAGNTADPAPAAKALGLELARLEDHLVQVLGSAER